MKKENVNKSEIEKVIEKSFPQELADHAGKDSFSDISVDMRSWAVYGWITDNLEIRYIPDTEDFIVCNDGIWEVDNEIIGMLTARLMVTAFKPSILNEVKSYVQNMDIVRQDELGVANNEIPFLNGVLNLETRELRDIEPDDYVIRPIPHEYNSEINYNGTNFRGFMRDVVPDETQRRTLQEFAGYLFVRGELPYQKAMMLIGEPAAGKGSFLRIIQKMLGNDNIMNASLQQLAGQKFSAYRLENKLANIYPDLSGEGLDASEVKTLTGDDMRQVEQKYKSPTDIRVTAKLMFAMNETPPLENDDDAFYRRMLFAEFPVRHTDNPDDDHPDIDPSIEEKIKEHEIQAVINWALDGYDRLEEQERFTGTLTTDEARMYWHISGDPVARFIEERIVEDYDTEPLPTKEIVDEFKKGMIGTGRHVSIGKNSMTRRVQNHFKGHTSKSNWMPSEKRTVRSFDNLSLQPE